MALPVGEILLSLELQARGEATECGDSSDACPAIDVDGLEEELSGEGASVALEWSAAAAAAAGAAAAAACA